MRAGPFSICAVVETAVVVGSSLAAAAVHVEQSWSVRRTGLYYDLTPSSPRG